MPSILRPMLIWFAALCLAGASLLPLGALARATTAADAMAICSTHANSGPLPLPLVADHLHCHYCSGDPNFLARLPVSATGSLRATLIYHRAQVSAAMPTRDLSRARQWTRAPPG